MRCPPLGFEVRHSFFPGSVGLVSLRSADASRRRATQPCHPAWQAGGDNALLRPLTAPRTRTFYKPRMKIAIHPKRMFSMFVQAAKAWSDDYAPSMGAAIA